jgi:molybdopterin-guanine dinucleotide biosynthesis protein A
MVGVVLCGGQSSRMGEDKGLLQQTGKSFAQTARDKLETLGLRVIVSINKSQEQEYSLIFPPEMLIIDEEPGDAKGPLLGIVSCHLHHKAEDLFVLACDLPLMDRELLRVLAKKYYQFPGASVYLFANNGEPEPLCGIYTAQALSSVQDMLEKGNLTKNSMKFVLQNLVVDSIELSEKQKISFKNFNNPSDLI